MTFPTKLTKAFTRASAIISGLAILTPLIAASQSAIVLNEVLAINESAAEINEIYPDYIELLNTSEQAVNLGGLHLSDDPADPESFTFPANTVLDPGQHLVVWCDGMTNNPGLHAEFKINASGEAAILTAPNGITVLDSISFGPQIADYSIGRAPNGTGQWTLNKPSPGRSNLAQPLGDPSQVYINEWMSLNSSGSDWIELYSASELPVNLDGLYLDDSDSSPESQPLHALSFIAPKGFLLFQADGQPELGALHLGFKLTSDGEPITLFKSDATTIIDHITFGPMNMDESRGRFPDGADNFITFPPLNTTPGRNNFKQLTDVIINEVLTHTDPPFEDAIELHNTTGADVDIGHWWLSNSKNNPKKYQIPPDTIVSAHGFKVFYEYQFGAETSTQSGFRLNSAHGDEVYLFTADASGNLTGSYIGVTFGAALNAFSIGRVQTSIGFDFFPLKYRTFGEDSPSGLAEFRAGRGKSNAPPLVGPVVINEIMYHPPESVSLTNSINDNSFEYIELLNISDTVTPLYDPDYSTNTWGISNAVDFAFPRSVSIPPGGMVVVVGFDPELEPSKLQAFKEYYSISDTTQIYGPFDGNLSNAGEIIELYRPDRPQLPPHTDAGFVPYVIADKVEYTDSSPWPAEPDGNGPALSKLNPEVFGNDPTNWGAVTPTPGYAHTPDFSDILYTDESGLKLYFNGKAGYKYLIQFKDSLSDDTWQDLTTTGRLTSTHQVEITDTNTSNADARFYRLIVNPGM